MRWPSGSRKGLARLAADGFDRATVPVLLTAHSLPRRVADQEPDYLAQLSDTAYAVAARAGLGPTRGDSAGRAPVTSRASG